MVWVSENIIRNDSFHARRVVKPAAELFRSRSDYLERLFSLLNVSVVWKNELSKKIYVFRVVIWLFSTDYRTNHEFIRRQ
jgi:hypothetical protein